MKRHKCMENREFELCKRKCNSYLKNNHIGKIQMIELNLIFQSVFMRGYELGKEKRND